MLIVVLDTNVLVSALSATSIHHPILSALIQKKYFIAVSTEIFMEYEEQIKKRYNEETAAFFFNFIAYSPQVLAVEPSFQFHLITTDKDDNKFVDCALAANAHFIVSNDRHFNVLAEVTFPKVVVMKAEAFMQLINT